MAFSNRVLTITQDYFVPKVVDTILNSNTLAVDTLKKTKSWHGEKMKFPIKVSKNTTGSSFQGFDTFSTSATNNRQLLQFTPTNYKITVSLPLDEIAVNNTEEGILNLIDVEMTSAAQDGADDIGSMFYSDGTGNSSKDFLGLGALVDDGSSVSTIGGLSRSTYTTLQSTVTASGGSLSLAKMATLWNSVTSGGVQPTIGRTTETVFSLYEQLLNPQERIIKQVGLRPEGLKGGSGYTGLDYKGIPIIMDEKCTSGVLFFLNENFLDFYALPFPMTEPVKYKPDIIEGNDYSNVKGMGFSWTGWIKPVDQAAIVGHIILSGNFLTQNPKRHGKLTGLTTV